MSLADDAATDWQEIMNDDIGATWPCTVTSPAGLTEDFMCRHSDIHQQVDLSTNEVVSGRQLVVSISLLDLDEAGMTAIKSVEDNTKKPWKIDVKDITGKSGVYKVVESNPDASLGNMLLFLEILKNG